MESKLLNTVIFEPFICVQKVENRLSRLPGGVRRVGKNTRLIHYTDPHFTNNKILQAWLADDNYILIMIKKPVNRSRLKPGFAYWKRALSHIHRCSACGLWKPDSEFYAKNTSEIVRVRDVFSMCKKCSYKSDRKWQPKQLLPKSNDGPIGKYGVLRHFLQNVVPSSNK